MKTAIQIALTILAVVHTAHADLAFSWESAERATSPEIDGSGVLGSIQFIGTRLHLQDTVHLSSGGATMFGNSNGSTFFFAVLELAGQNALPVGSPFDGSEVLTTAIITADTAIADYTASLDLLLNPGYYGLVIGTGEYGATGIGGMPTNNSDYPESSYFAWLDVDPRIPLEGGSPSSSYGLWATRASGGSGYRFTLEGIVIPEPSTVFLLLYGVASITIMRKRTTSRPTEPPDVGPVA